MTMMVLNHDFITMVRMMHKILSAIPRSMFGRLESDVDLELSQTEMAKGFGYTCLRTPSHASLCSCFGERDCH